MNVEILDVARRFEGIREVPGHLDNPQILAMLQLDQRWPEHDEIAWCSAFVNYVAWLLGLPRSKSLGARSWLDVGQPILLADAEPGDVVVLERGRAPQGHVGFFVSFDKDEVLLLGGNQSDGVTESHFPAFRVIGVRRLT